MISKPTAKFENIFLTPLGIILPVIALVSLFHKAWFVGIYFIFAWFWNAIVGQSLHPDKNVEQLKQGGLTDEPNVRKDELIPNEEYQRLAKAIFFTALMLGISTVVLMNHQDCRWFVSIPVGLVVWFVGVFAISAISIYRKK